MRSQALTKGPLAGRQNDIVLHKTKQAHGVNGTGAVLPRYKSVNLNNGL